ncbi:HlyD family secretion protein [Francisella philomiragia]|uniref:Efflux transporter, RND family, MFP subunit n=1 Tax=Francisella philomiragia TaxID=28110 RepID=A0AAW3DB48_9GAMM|nr:HlyD family secretion protein [Francisella philomiragia]KFJ43359.1 efflux transporter, RND family, MFP subunit [Francisella philomiragia]MBK2254413.1 HlyD family secretion protein [Francisella philomiragia]MBK2272794.1 HlyD family secretion protein [Francisella philomiragia]MBK2276567.1 HlyD family secretion protein [Francisella philomiragia]MBK2280688.1 HlyD family secretion protein [Francisella philomiragia]
MPNKKTKTAISIIIICLALFSLYSIWRYYLYSPWTRDGRIRANIITIAPDVSGFVTKIYVFDNQKVKKGQLIFTIDRDRYAATLDEKEAELKHAIMLWELADRQYQRREQLGKDGSISLDTLDEYHMQVKLKKADLEKAKAEARLAKINLDRTSVYAPADGTINNIELRQGNYVVAAKPVMSLVEANSFYVTGYFEETKLPNIKIGDKANIELMSGGELLHGHVISIGKAVADNNTDVNSQLLPKVQQTYDWVRLSKRIPIDIALDVIPKSVNLISGINATVTIQ